MRKIETPKLGSRLLGPFLVVFGICYLTFHALSGERGIYALLKEERRLEVLQTELTKVTAERTELEHRTRLMSPGSLDLDLLDEQSRALLGVSAPGEMVVLLPDKGKK